MKLREDTDKARLPAFWNRLSARLPDRWAHFKERALIFQAVEGHADPLPGGVVYRGETYKWVNEHGSSSRWVGVMKDDGQNWALAIADNLKPLPVGWSRQILLHILHLLFPDDRRKAIVVSVVRLAPSSDHG